MTLVIGFTASYRRESFSSKLTQHILAGAKDSGGKIMEYSLPSLAIKTCTGCFSCQKAPFLGCHLTDDLTPIFDDLRNADGIVLGSPVFTFSWPAPAKLLLDRFVALHTPKETALSGKRFAAALCYGDDDPLISGVDLLRSSVEKLVTYYQMELAGVAHHPTGDEKLLELTFPLACQRAEEIGSRLVRHGN